MDGTFDSLYHNRGNLIAGIDESGVSDIAGPLVAACVVLPKINLDFDDFRIYDVDDSKKIPEKYREEHAEVILGTALGIGFGEVSPQEVDYLGKKRSTILAMVRAIAACQNKEGGKISPDFLMIDGQNLLPTKTPQVCIKGGDGKSLCIASASIMAKVYRDGIMKKLHEQFPYYNWNRNKGHPCKKHLEGIDNFGIQAGIHRTKTWPFITNKKKTINEKVWHSRRSLWREKTLEKLVRVIQVKPTTPTTLTSSSKESKLSKGPQPQKR